MIIASDLARIKINCSPEIAGQIAQSEFIENYIPALNIDQTDALYDHEITLDYSDTTDPNFDFSPEKSNLTGKLGELISLKDIITTIDHCLEYVRQSKSIYLIHGSSVSHAGNGFIFMGQVSGLGKTTLALNLCLKKQFLLIGDEKILLNANAQIIGGSTRIIYNKPALYHSIGTELDNLSPEQLKQKIQISQDHPRAGFFIVPMIFNKSTELEIDRWDKQKTNFHLYEELTRKIRGTSRRIQNFSYPLPSLDNFDLAIRRSNFCEAISQKCQAMSIRGNLDSVMDSIADLAPDQNA